MDVLTILAVTAMVAVPSWLTLRQGKIVSEVREQVKNQHSTNLRDDVDRVIAAVETLSHDVRALRTDLMAEEDRRRAQIAGIYDELEHRAGKRRL